jgi:hypothetical protein
MRPASFTSGRRDSYGLGCVDLPRIGTLSTPAAEH